jgi:hypothetical protein
MNLTKLGFTAVAIVARAVDFNNFISLPEMGREVKISWMF